MSPILAFTVLNCFIGICSGWLFHHNLCSPTWWPCPCGKQNTKHVHFQINQCWYDSLQGPYCAPCTNPTYHCVKFLNCKKCHPSSVRECKSCPSGKFGTWCDLTCDCKNGGSCDRTGQCQCPKGFRGPKCEKRKRQNKGIECYCKNGGSCDRTGQCRCPKGFRGPKCEKKKRQNKRIECGFSSSPRRPLIRNGNLTSIGQWPWQVALYERGNSQGQKWELTCGGSLLNSLWIATAAHCVTHQISVNDTRSNGIRIFVGKYHRKLVDGDKSVQEGKIEAFYVHPDYFSHTQDSDIALVKLKQPVKFSRRVQPVCLPTQETSEVNIVDGKTGVVTGWGLDENNVLTETLQQAELPVVTQENCQQAYTNLMVTENMFCAGHHEGLTPDACKGDSGGPMVFRDLSSKRPRWVLEGIVSWGSSKGSGCGISGHYGGYLRVSEFVDWIKCHLQNPEPLSGEKKCVSSASSSSPEISLRENYS